MQRSGLLIAILLLAACGVAACAAGLAMGAL